MGGSPDRPKAVNAGAKAGGQKLHLGRNQRVARKGRLEGVVSAPDLFHLCRRSALGLILRLVDVTNPESRIASPRDNLLPAGARRVLSDCNHRLVGLARC